MADVMGWTAAGLTLLTFHCSNMQRLRVLALAANGVFVVYASVAGLAPVLALHLALIPVNLYRLLQLRARRRATAATAPTDTTAATAATATASHEGALDTAQPVHRAIDRHRAARMQLGGCSSSLRKPLRSQPRGPIHSGSAAATWPNQASVGTGGRPPGKRLDGMVRQPLLVSLQQVEPAAAPREVDGHPSPGVWPGPRVMHRPLALLSTARSLRFPPDRRVVDQRCPEP